MPLRHPEQRGDEEPALSGAKGPLSRWETLAREDAEFYIWTDVAKGDDFFASGRRDASRILEVVAPFLARQDVALEIGCGVGRLTLPMSAHFGRIIAVDVAPTMLRKLAENCASRGIGHVAPMASDDAWDKVAPVDFAYSRIVFQHIESWAVIERYLARISACLAPTGVAYAQFDTRPPDLLYHVKNALPDFVLPRTLRRGVRRIRRTVSAIEQAAWAGGLAIAHQRGAGTFDTEFVFRRAQ